MLWPLSVNKNAHFLLNISLPIKLLDPVYAKRLIWGIWNVSCMPLQHMNSVGVHAAAYMEGN